MAVDFQAIFDLLIQPTHTEGRRDKIERGNKKKQNVELKGRQKGDDVK